VCEEMNVSRTILYEAGDGKRRIQEFVNSYVDPVPSSADADIERQGV
jgi:hypothetical protein